jgi:hypothetical protein
MYPSQEEGACSMVISTYLEATSSKGSSKAWEQVNRSTLQRIADLFPAPTLGQIFVARFVERAATERSIIPDLKAGDVVICTKGIAELAEALDLSYDTTQKYVALFRALGMLQKRKFMGDQIAFVLSLGIYHPPHNLEANLDYLLERSKAKKSRTKYHGLVRDVKQRCLVYGLIDQGFTDALRQLHSLVQPEAGLSRRKLEQRLAQAQHLVSTLIAQAMAGHLPQALNRVDSRPSTRPSHLFGTGNAGENGEREPDGESTQRTEAFSPTSETPMQLHLSERRSQIDSEQEGHDTESPHRARLGRFERKAIPFNPPASVTQVDSLVTQVDSLKEGRAGESTQKSSLSRFEEHIPSSNPSLAPKQVDSEVSILTSNVNVTTLMSNITSNVKLVATFCRQALGEPVSKQRIYQNLFDECEHDTQAIAAALLFTLAHRRDGTMTKPAAVFLARCRDFHKQGVSEEAAALVQQYGSLSYPQLLAALQKSAAPSRQRASPPASSPHPTTPASLPPLPQWGTIPRLIPVESSRLGMSRQEALQVVARARGDRRTKMCRVDLEQLAGGTYAVLLDNTITAVPRQTYFYSLREWEARTAVIEDCFELFGVARSGRRCLADALRERRAAK